MTGTDSFFPACSVDRKGFSLSDTKQTCARSDANCLRLGGWRAPSPSDLIEDLEGETLNLEVNELETEEVNDVKGLTRRTSIIMRNEWSHHYLLEG